MSFWKWIYMTPCYHEQVLWSFLKCQYVFKYHFIISSFLKSEGATVIMLSDLVHDRECLLMICYQGYFCPMFSWEDCSAVWYLLVFWHKGHWSLKASTCLPNSIPRTIPLTFMYEVQYILKCVESKIDNQIGHKWWTITQNTVMIK